MFEGIFARGNAGNAGWTLAFFNQGMRLYGTNSNPNGVIGTLPAFTSQDVGRTHVVIGTWNNGTMTPWLNGVVGTPASSGAGYTSSATSARIGNLISDPCRCAIIHECGFLDNFNAGATFAALTAQWREDVQRGRYPEWPRVPAVNLDWNYSALDIVGGGGSVGPIWTPRYTPLDTMTYTPGSSRIPQSASLMPRF